MDIKEAIEPISKYINGSIRVNKGLGGHYMNGRECEEFTNALQIVVAFCRKVESIKGLPKKKIGNEFSPSIPMYKVGYNQAIDDCKLYIAKMLDEGKMEKERDYQQILKNEGLSDWKIKWNTGGGLCVYKHKEIWLSDKPDLALFLHEVAHALCPKEICGECWVDITKCWKAHNNGHNAIWGDKFTNLVGKYMWSLDELEEKES